MKITVHVSAVPFDDMFSTRQLRNNMSFEDRYFASIYRGGGGGSSSSTSREPPTSKYLNPGRGSDKHATHLLDMDEGAKPVDPHQLTDAKVYYFPVGFINKS